MTPIMVISLLARIVIGGFIGGLIGWCIGTYLTNRALERRVVL